MSSPDAGDVPLICIRLYLILYIAASCCQALSSTCTKVRDLCFGAKETHHPYRLRTDWHCRAPFFDITLEQYLCLPQACYHWILQKDKCVCEEAPQSMRDDGSSKWQCVLSHNAQLSPQISSVSLVVIGTWRVCSCYLCFRWRTFLLQCLFVSMECVLPASQVPMYMWLGCEWIYCRGLSLFSKKWLYFPQAETLWNVTWKLHSGIRWWRYREPSMVCVA